MRSLLTTALVALAVGAMAGATVSALAQSEPALEPAAVSSINADKVDGFHAVGAGASRAKRAGKLVATNRNGLLPRNIVKHTTITVTRVQGEQVNFAAGDVGQTVITCPDGARAVGGGFDAVNPEAFNLFGSRPTLDLTGWRVAGWTTAASDGFVPYVVCIATQPASAMKLAVKGQ